MRENDPQFNALLAACIAGAKYTDALKQLQNQGAKGIVEDLDGSLDALFMDWHDKAHVAIGAGYAQLNKELAEEARQRILHPYAISLFEVGDSLAKHKDKMAFKAGGFVYELDRVINCTQDEAVLVILKAVH